MPQQTTLHSGINNTIVYGSRIKDHGPHTVTNTRIQPRVWYQQIWQPIYPEQDTIDLLDDVVHYTVPLGRTLNTSALCSNTYLPLLMNLAPLGH